MNYLTALALFLFGTVNWYFPGYHGWFEKSDPNVRPGEGRIVGAVLIVGAAIVAFLP